MAREKTYPRWMRADIANLVKMQVQLSKGRISEIEDAEMLCGCRMWLQARRPDWFFRWDPRPSLLDCGDYSAQRRSLNVVPPFII